MNQFSQSDEINLCPNNDISNGRIVLKNSKNTGYLRLPETLNIIQSAQINERSQYKSRFLSIGNIIYRNSKPFVKPVIDFTQI